MRMHSPKEQDRNARSPQIVKGWQIIRLVDVKWADVGWLWI